MDVVIKWLFKLTFSADKYFLCLKFTVLLNQVSFGLRCSHRTEEGMLWVRMSLAKKQQQKNPIFPYGMLTFIYAGIFVCFPILVVLSYVWLLCQAMSDYAHRMVQAIKKRFNECKSVHKRILTQRGQEWSSNHFISTSIPWEKRWVQPSKPSEYSQEMKGVELPLSPENYRTCL